MIISRGNLLVSMVTTDDKNIPILDTVYVAPDGSTVGSNGRVILAVSPVTEKVKAAVPLEGGTTLEEGVVLPASFVSEVLKNLPRDKKFGGLLEHASLLVDHTNTDVKVVLTDAKQTKTIKGKRITQRKYIDYMSQFSSVFTKLYNGQTVVLNLKRLLHLLTGINKICEDQSGETPVYISFADDGNIMIRATDMKGTQDIVGLMTAYHNEEGVIKPMSLWELLLSVGKTIGRKRSCAQRIKPV